jgi:hypothetical protein
MMKTEEREMDLPGRFMNPESIEKAPEGFTDNVMSAVHVESHLVVRKKAWAAGNIVPIAVLGVMLLLIIISLFSGTDNKTVAGNEISKIFQHFTLPEIKAPTLPGLAIYISLGLFVLWIFDLLLGRIFYKRQ